MIKNLATTNKYEYGIPKNCDLRNCFKIDCKESDNIHTDYKYEEEFKNFSTYDKNIFNIKDNTDISGYFQSYKYIESDFKLEFKQDYFFQYNKDSVGVHIRRTDYVDNKFNKEQPIEYYNKAMDLFGNNYNFYIISDDINWCKQNFKGDNILFSNNISSYEDLYCYSKCDNQIISASSFSWWGAWFNAKADKTIIYPYYWLHDNFMNMVKDLIPPTWLPIK